MQPKILNRISVRNENEVFGIERKSGLMIYDKTVKKMYVLLESARAIDSLASIGNKKELVKSSEVLLILGVTNYFDTIYGYDSDFGGGFGSLTPDIVDEELVDALRVDVTQNTIIFGLVSSNKLNELDSVEIDIDGYGTIEIPWFEGASVYTFVNEGVTTYIVSKEGQNLNVTVHY